MSKKLYPRSKSINKSYNNIKIKNILTIPKQTLLFYTTTNINDENNIFIKLFLNHRKSSQRITNVCI